VVDADVDREARDGARVLLGVAPEHDRDRPNACGERTAALALQHGLAADRHQLLRYAEAP
jgi:hypothetical protein